MAVHGAIDHLAATLASVHAQTLAGVEGGMEVVIVDDGNTPEDRDRLLSHTKGDARIRVIHNDKNVGLTRSLIRACQHARADYIARIDCGDLMVPRTRLEEQVELLRANPDVVLIAGGLEVVDCVNRRRYRSRYQDCIRVQARQFERYRIRFPHVTVMFKKDAYFRSGGYAPGARVGQDSELWPRLLQQGDAISVGTVYAIAPMRARSISVAENRRQILGKIGRVWRQASGSQNTWSAWLRTVPKVLSEVVKLGLPTGLRITLRYRRHYDAVGTVTEHECNSLEALSASYGFGEIDLRW